MSVPMGLGLVALVGMTWAVVKLWREASSMLDVFEVEEGPHEADGR